MFKVLDGATSPTRATRYSAMVDLYANADVVIGAGETKIVPLGVKIDLEHLHEELYIYDERFDIRYDTHDNLSKSHYFMSSHFLELHPRSSLRAKGLIIGVGVIDLDYPDEIGLIVHNPTQISYQADDDHYINELNDGSPFFINKDDKIAQCTLVEHKGYLLSIESEVERVGGFGSTTK